MSYRDSLPTTREVGRESVRWGFWSLIVGVVAIVVIVALTIVAGGFGWVTADWRGASDARNKTVGNGTYRIAQYNHFYDLCGNVQALEDQIALAEADKSLPAGQKATNLLALRNQRVQLIRQYNADARKSGTAAQFKASDLPAILTTEGATTC